MNTQLPSGSIFPSHNRKCQPSSCKSHRFVEFTAATPYDSCKLAGGIMDTIRFVDTTLRDGHQSLWAENMTTGMMVPITTKLDTAGFEGIELISGSHLKKTVRELKEDPWERVRLVSKLITKTPLRLIAGRVNTFEYNPPSMYRLFVERMFANGIREARISDEWNDYEGWKFRVGECHRAGLKSILNLIYSVSPKHSDEYFALRTRQAASLNPYRLCLKDPGGDRKSTRLNS